MFVLKQNTQHKKTNKPDGVEKKQPLTDNEKKQPLTDNEKKELLVGYAVVPPDTWETIPYKSHIRYIKTDGSFVRGGFFKNLWVKGGMSMLQLENNLNRKAPGYVTWAVPFDTIKVVYKKYNKPSSIEIASLYKKIEQQRVTINTLVDAINSLDGRVKALESK
jgi:hypothetical protein